MLQNYFRIAWRHWKKDRQFTLLNIIGLSTGLACTLLIWLWVSNEWKVDGFHQKGDRIFQVLKNNPLADGGIMTSEITPVPLADAILKEMPEVEEVVAAKLPPPMDNSRGILSFNDTRIKARAAYTSPNFFSVFSYRLLQGNKDQVLAGKYNILISQELALKLFHTENPVGRTITWERNGWRGGFMDGVYTVSGVFEAPSFNSSLQFDVVFPLGLFLERDAANNNWNSSNTSTFIVLKKGADLSRLNDKIRDLMRRQYTKVYGENDLKYVGTLFLQHFPDRYLHNRYENGAPSGGKIEYIRLFSIVAIFILVIACINFMNLSTAKAARRIKETGIRKVMGAKRSALVFQFLAESIGMSFLSLFVALLLVWLCLPAFREITGQIPALNIDTRLVCTVIAITGLTGLLAGSYPAFYLSGFRPALTLKGKFTGSGGESWIRKGLVVFQFSLSVLLILSVMVVYRQMKLIQTKALGFNKDNIIRFSNEGPLQQNQEAFLARVKTIPGVINASGMEGDLTGDHSGGGGINWPGKDPNKGIEFSGLYVDYSWAETLGLKMAEGRTFSPTFGSDTGKVIFNETAIAQMKLDHPVGKIVTMWGKRQEIIGVVKDFHFESLYSKVGPFFMRYNQKSSNLLIKIAAGKESATIARIQDLYKSFSPGLPFEYAFMDEDFQVLYSAEQRIAILSRWFAGIAILISCLGLFGLAAFTAKKREKEIGIRKVVGASVSGLVMLLVRDYLRLIAISLLIGFPLAGWALHHWLQSFAYRVPLGADIFLIAGVSIFAVTLVTISVQSIRASLANPVKSLRAE